MLWERSDNTRGSARRRGAPNFLSSSSRGAVRSMGTADESRSFLGLDFADGDGEDSSGTRSSDARAPSPSNRSGLEGTFFFFFFFSRRAFVRVAAGQTQKSLKITSVSINTSDILGYRETSNGVAREKARECQVPPLPLPLPTKTQQTHLRNHFTSSSLAA